MPSKAARSLVTRRAGAIALIVSEGAPRTADDPFMGRFFGDPFFGRVVGGVLSVLGPLGLHVPFKLAGDAGARAQLIAS